MERHQIRLEVAQTAAFRRVAHARGEPQAGLLLGFVRELHRAAARGEPVPPDSGEPPGRLGPSLRYTLGSAARQAADDAMVARGSSLTVGLRAKVADYIEAGGNPRHDGVSGGNGVR